MICGAMQLQAMRVSGLMALPAVDVAAYYFSKQLGQCGQILEISKGKRKEGIIRAGRMEGKKRIFSWGQTQQRRKVFGMLAAYFN